jgi:hypothetical protein
VAKGRNSKSDSAFLAEIKAKLFPPDGDFAMPTPPPPPPRTKWPRPPRKQFTRGKMLSFGDLAASMRRIRK